MRSFRAVALAAVMLSVQTARADEPLLGPALSGALYRSVPPPCDVAGPGPCKRREPTTARRILGTALAVVPGVVVRGLGSYVTHDTRTARRLPWMAGIGLGMAVVGGVPIGVTGGNPYLLIPFAPMLVSGVGLFLQSWAADISNAAGATGLGSPRARTPYSLQIGTTWVHDAYFDRALLHGIARTATGRFEVRAAGYVDVEDRYRAGDLGIAFRILGMHATSGEAITDGGFLEVRTTGRLRHDSDDRVQVATFEAELAGRLDLDWISNQLAGSYAELSTGGGIERAAFHTEDELGGLLLGRFAWGMYLGRRGELQLFYDHRRDSLAGGIAAYRAAGFVGSVGTSLDVRLRGPWAARAELEIGSAWVTSFGVRYQGGAP